MIIFIFLIGSAQIPRFACSAHNLNLMIRSSISEQKYLESIIKQLNSLSSSIRNSISESQRFRELKCRPKIECKTRWSSEFLLLLSIKKAYDLNAITDSTLPVPIESIEKYIQILKKGYEVSISFQSNECSIADVVPNISYLIYHWGHLEVTGEHKELCLFLVHYLK